MQDNKTVRIWVTSALLTVLIALYGVWIITEAPSYWETFLFVTLMLLLLAVAIIRFVPYAITYVATGKEPHLERVGERTFRRCGTRELFRVVLWILILRLALLLLTYVMHYAQFGYTETFFRVQRIWLDFYHHETSFPAYPLLSNVFWFVSFNFNHARFLASYLFTGLAGAMLYYWVLLDFDRYVARHAVLCFFLLPAACLLLGTLPDTLFLMLSMMCLVFARKRRFLLSNLFAMLAVTTHLLGLLLFVPVIIEYTEMLRDDLRNHREESKGYLLHQILPAASFLLIPLGFVIVLLYSDIQFGTPTSLIRTAQEWYGYHPSLPFSSLAKLSDRFFEALRTANGDVLKYELGNTIPNLFYVLLGVLLLIAAPGRIRTSYIAYLAVTYLAVLCVGNLLETPRVLTMCAPFVLTLTLTVRKKWQFYAVSVVSFGLMLFYLWAVVGGYTIYSA